MKAAHTLFQFPTHFVGSDINDTIRKCRFRPPIAQIPATALQSDEADVLFQCYRTDALTFAYVQSDIRKPFDMFTYIPTDGFFFVFNDIGVTAWDVARHDDCHYNYSGCQTALSMPAGRHEKLIAPQKERFYCFAVTGKWAMHTIAYQLIEVAPLYSFIMQSHNDPVCLPIFTFTRDTARLLSRLVNHQKPPMLLGPFIEETLARLLILFNERLILLWEKEEKKAPEIPLYDRAMNHINEHFHDPDLSVDKIADRLNVSVSTLNKAFRIRRSKVHETVNYLRLTRASSLLKTTEKPVADIAAEVGCFNPSNFTRLFKEMFQYTPTEFRNRD